MRSLLIENYDHCCFCNHDWTHFFILRVSANALYDCRLISFHSLLKSAFLHSKGLLCLSDKQNNTWLLEDMEFLLTCSTRHLTRSLRSLVSYQNSIAHKWDVESNTWGEIPYLQATKFKNTRREFPYLRASMYYSILFDIYYFGRKRARIRKFGLVFLPRKMHNKRYAAVFNWRKAMWWT